MELIKHTESSPVNPYLNGARALEGPRHEVVLDGGPEIDFDIGAASACLYSTSVALDPQRCSRILGCELLEEHVEPRNWSLIDQGRRSAGGEYLDSVERR